MGYSNVTGDLNVYSVTSTKDLSVRGNSTMVGNLSVLGVSSFQNVIASNLTVTNAFIITATNTQISNSLTINNSGTATALFVNQNEYPAMIHNVAEFWDHSTLAMVIDPNGNVAIHQARSDGYALSVVQGVLVDNITATGNYTGSGFGLTNVPVTGLYGALSSIQIQNTQSNITSLGTLVTLNTSGISNLNGSILGTLATPAQPNITSVGLLSNLAVSNSISVSNIVATGNLSVQLLTNLFSANIITENVQTLNSVFSNILNLNVSTGANITQLTVTTFSNISSANIVTANHQSLNTVFSNILNLNVSTGANITQLTVTTLANIVSANIVTENVQTLNSVFSNILNLNVSTGANITQLTVTNLANILSANLVTSNIQSLNVVSSNIGTLNATSIFIGTANLTTANISSANIVTENVQSLNVSTGANITQLTVTTLSNISSANIVAANIATTNISSANIVTENVQTLNSVFSNILNLNVSTGANITQLTVTTLSNISSANIVSSNIQTLNSVFSNILNLNVNSGANITQLTVTTLANISSANIVTENVQTLNSVFSNILNLNVSTGANITQLTVSTLSNISSANIVSANVQTLNSVTSNILNLNVSTGANITQLTVTTLSNISSANIVTANIGTINATTMNLLNLNVTSTANFSTANFISANIANIYTTNIVGFVGSQWTGTVGGPLYYLTGNVGINTSTGLGSNLTVAGNIYASTNITTPVMNVTSYANISVLNVYTSANIYTANFVSANIANIYTTNIVGFVGSQWSGSVGGPIYYNTGNVAIGSSTNPGANLTVTGNLFVSNGITTSNISATGIISGVWNGTSQGTLLTLATNLSTGTAFATSTDAPTLQAYHVPLQSFTQNAIQAVYGYTITSQGLIKFNTTGLYQLTMVFVMDSPVVKVALGTNTTSTFPSSTSAYTYVYTVSSAASPSDIISIPINVQNISNYYYIDIFCRSGTNSGTYYLTAGASVSGSQNGTYIQISPFGNYVSSGQNSSAGLVVTTSGSTLSSPLAQSSPLTLSSNTYHMPLTSAAGWTTAGTSSIVAISPNGNLQFYQSGLFQVTLCVNATSQFLMQIGIGTSSSDSSLPSTIGPYIYQYRPSVTQDPTTTIVLPFSITDITKYYYLDTTFGPSTTVSILSTSTFVTVTPVGSYMPSPMATSSLIVSQVVTGQSTSYTALSSDSYIGMSNGGTVTIPQGATLTRGKMYTIKDESGKAGTNLAYNIIIQMSGADTIDGQSNAYVQLGYTSVNLMWTGANNRWVFI